MALILNIDTATDIASVCLAASGESVQFDVNDNQQDHASWLHSTIADMLGSHRVNARELAAIAVTIGPGSYTGLRVGLSSAKGFCFALSIPLIAVSTLKMIAFSELDQEFSGLYCPMIDARRMEVFTAVYDSQLNELQAPQALILDESGFENLLSNQKLIFCGNGSKKLQGILHHPNAIYMDNKATAKHLARLSHSLYIEKQFADVAYTAPLYVKEFFSPERKNVV